MCEGARSAPPCDDVLFESKGIPIDPSCLRSNPLRGKPRDEEAEYLHNEEGWNSGTPVSPGTSCLVMRLIS